MKLVIGIKRYCDKNPIETALGFANETLKSSTVVEAPIPRPTIKRKAREMYGRMSAISLIFDRESAFSSPVFLWRRKCFFRFLFNFDSMFYFYVLLLCCL